MTWGPVILLGLAIISGVWYVGKERGDLQARLARIETRQDGDDARIIRLIDAVFTANKPRGE